MTGRTHDLAAFTALVITFIFLSETPQMTLTTAIVAFGANFIGGLFPDIDQRSSDFWDNFRLGPVASRIIVPLLGGHRNVSHSLVGIGIIGFGAYWLLQFISTIVLVNVDMQIVWYAFMIGLIAHIFTDLPTKAGVPLLWPLKWNVGFPPIRALRITSGKFIENFVIFPSLLILTGYLLLQNQNKVLEFLRSLI